METVRVTVLHFYNHPILYAFMPHDVFKTLEYAFLHDEPTVELLKEDFEAMIHAYFETLKN
jgi:hypothetical protein